jgi:hypothetical protein
MGYNKDKCSLGGMELIIRGFAMVDGVSFSNGKRRVTGRIREDGSWQIVEGGRWFQRFSKRQVFAGIGIIGLEVVSGLSPRIPEILVWSGYILLFAAMFWLQKSHRRFHGAEHLAVNLFEGRAEETVLHPGCGSNLILLLLPGLIITAIFLSWWMALIFEAIYASIVIYLIWPRLYRGLGKGQKYSEIWWRISRHWQRLFIAQPEEEEARLAQEVLRSLLGKSLWGQ